MAYLSLFSASAPPSRRCCQARAGRARAHSRAPGRSGAAWRGLFTASAWRSLRAMRREGSGATRGATRRCGGSRRARAARGGRRGAWPRWAEAAPSRCASPALGRLLACARSSQSSCATAAHLLLLLLHSIALHLRLLLRAALFAGHRHRCCCCCLGASSGELLLSGLAGVALGLAHGQSHSSNRARALALPFFFCSGAGAYLMRLAGDGRVRRGLVLRERVPDALGKHALAALVGGGRSGRVGGV